MAHVPTRFRGLIRWVFPGIYALNAIIYGIYGGASGGSNVLRMALGAPGANLLCVAIGLAAAVAFCGVAFGGGWQTRRGQQVERAGAIGLAVSTVAYLVILIMALGAGGVSPIATIATTSAFLLLTTFRVLDLSAEIGKRRRPGTSA